MPAQDLRGFSEKVALVTGGGVGIGRAVALQLALQGAYVLAQSQPDLADDSRRALQELRDIGTLAQVVEADVTSTEGVEEMVAAVNERYGRLDLLVNASVIAIDTNPEVSDEVSWDLIMSHTLRSAWLSSISAKNLMHGRPSPAIVNFAFESSTGSPAIVLAAATAANGLTGLTRTLAAQLGPKTRVNCVVARDPVGSKPPAANEIARAVVYLLSADAKAITGQTLTVGSQA